MTTEKVKVYFLLTDWSLKIWFHDEQIFELCGINVHRFQQKTRDILLYPDVQKKKYFQSNKMLIVWLTWRKLRLLTYFKKDTFIKRFEYLWWCVTVINKYSSTIEVLLICCCVLNQSIRVGGDWNCGNNYFISNFLKYSIWCCWGKPKLKSGVSKRNAGWGRPLGGGGAARRGTRTTESHPTDDIRFGSSLSHDGDPRATATHCSMFVRYL